MAVSNCGATELVPLTCEGVYIARREKRLLQETELTEIIFRLFRSSETLLQLTRTELKRERHGE
jgi:hypothetical protein